MRTHDLADPFEALLTRAFAAEPSAAVAAAMDARVTAAVEVSGRQAPREAEPLSRRPRRRTVVALGLAAALVLGGAGMSILGSFAWLTLEPSFRVAWERGEVLDLSEVIDGYRVTLHRAYADANQVVLAVSVEDVENRGHRQVSTLGGGIRVEGDGGYTGAGAISRPINRFASTDVYRGVRTDPEPPPADGHFVVTIEAIVVHDGATAPPTVNEDEWNPWQKVPGPWVFAFDLPIAGGYSPTGLGLAAEHAGTTVVLESLRFSPTTIRAVLRMDGGSVSGSGWWPIVMIARGDETFTASVGRYEGEGRPAEVLTVAGVDDPSGEWTVTVSELVGDDADGQVRLSGPWVFRVTVP